MAKQVTIEGLPYSFPKDHVSGFTTPQGGGTFVRLKPPGEAFLLVLDSKADRLQMETGRIIVSRINFSEFSRVTELHQDGETVICGEFTHNNCGFQIDDDGFRWNIIFDREKLPDVTAFRERARGLISSYRRKKDVVG